MLLHLPDNSSEGFTSNVFFIEFGKEGGRRWSHKTNDRIEVVQNGIENPCAPPHTYTAQLYIINSEKDSYDE